MRGPGPRAVPAPAPPPAGPPPRRRRRLDLVLGIAIGIVLGLAVVAGFVFLGEAGSIDAPRIKGVDTGGPTQRAAPASPPGEAAARSGPVPGR